MKCFYSRLVLMIPSNNISQHKVFARRETDTYVNKWDAKGWVSKDSDNGRGVLSGNMVTEKGVGRCECP
ncbi:hypothetical protein TNCT_628421 [Trichonephila clavata]|uniref:Uncharacterized protein n=1 Tax=Trichonephila clavata TaxID=2740835 RepID=A0A8X6H5S5_TRICU|nr:hypothetical protein TNCT_628421 [Trichonephila clavata]